MAVTPDGKHERCLADLSESGSVGAPTHVDWNGPADRVILGHRALSKGLVETTSLAPRSSRPLWSRPNGTSVVYITPDGRLMKRSSFGGAATDISFLARHDDVTYHPAGEHIATTGLAHDGSYGLYLATNVGTEEKLLARGEAAKFITDLSFAANGQELFYEARHGPKNWHLHRLTIGKNAVLDTLATNELGFDYAVSHYDEFGASVAWTSIGDCAAGQPDRLHANYGKGFDIPDELKETLLRPIAWLPSGDLIFSSRPVGCDRDAAQDVYVLGRRNGPRLLIEDVGITAAVRAALPPPPPPPGEEQEVVA
jgi:hypothetical protein